MKTTRYLNTYLILSIIGAVLIIILVLLNLSYNAEIEIFDKFLLSVLFTVVCLFGISFAIKPNWVNVLIEHDTPGDFHFQPRSKSKKRRGHHPVCDEFKSHTIYIKGKTYCAGCTGLALGATVSIILILLYSIVNFEIPNVIYFIFIIIGFSLILLNFIQIIYFHKNKKLHLLSNFFMVISFLLVVMAIFQLTGSIIFGILGIMISILWLDTRIILSKWNHERICEKCKYACKEI